MGLIKENIEFQRGRGTKSALDIGLRRKIEKYMEDVLPNIDYNINDDLTINILSQKPISIPFEVMIKRFPDYIRFKKCHHNLDLSYREIEYLNGMPEEIEGNLYLDHNNIKSLEGFPKKIKENVFIHENQGEKINAIKIRKISKVGGLIYDDDFGK